MSPVCDAGDMDAGRLRMCPGSKEKHGRTFPCLCHDSAGLPWTGRVPVEGAAEAHYRQPRGRGCPDPRDETFSTEQRLRAYPARELLPLPSASVRSRPLLPDADVRSGQPRLRSVQQDRGGRPRRLRPLLARRATPDPPIPNRFGSDATAWNMAR